MPNHNQGDVTTPLEFLLVLTSDHITGATGKTATVTLSKNGATFGTTTGTVSEIGNGWYKLLPELSDVATAGPLVLHATAADCDPSDPEPWTIIATAGGQVGSPTSSLLSYLQTNLLDDAGTAIWSAAELGDNIRANRRLYITQVAGADSTRFISNRTFWLAQGTNSDEAPVLSVSVDGSSIGTVAGTIGVSAAGTLWEVEPLTGELCFKSAYGTVDQSSDVVATYYAVNLWRVAQQALLRRQQSTSLTGQQSSIRLGPLAKTVSGPSEMVQSFDGRISSFARFAAAWEASATIGKFQRQ